MNILLKRYKWVLVMVCLFLFGIGGFWFFKNSIHYPTYELGQEIDSFNEVPVYFNGSVSNVSGRNLSSNGYNYGLKYQCVEYVKRYYYDHLNHSMPNSYGHAKDFFNPNLSDGQINSERNLLQFNNPSKTKPKVNDLLIFDKTKFNPYGHVAIISKVSENQIEIVQQNAGAYSSSRDKFNLEFSNEKWNIENPGILGWLRKIQY